jgi:hypothetical protein
MKSRTEFPKKISRASSVDNCSRAEMIYLWGKNLLKAILEESQIDCLAIYNTGKHVLFRIFTRRQLEIKTIPQKLREKRKKISDAPSKRMQKARCHAK